VRPRIPPDLSIDTFDGRAWIGVIPFRMTGVRLRGLPPLPWLSAFPELNVRTYVTAGAKPGVWFFSLDAASALAVAVGRTAGLPYYRARMSVTAEGDGVRYAGRRIQPGTPPAELVAGYGPTGAVASAAPGSLAHFLTERYCFYTVGRDGRLRRGEIHHAPWPLQPAAAAFERNTLAAAAGLRLPEGAPLLHFARRLDAVAWVPRRA
jgi:hypothetical protein